jgi:hypothetical protein
LQLDLCHGGFSFGNSLWRSTSTKDRLLLISKDADFYLWPSVATDLIYIDAVIATLRSEA